MNQYITYDPEQEQTLQQFENLIKIQTPIIIVGPSGSGKLTLAKYGSMLITNQPPLLLNVQTATDCREALGQFGCSRKPGKFIFREGILSTAMREGRCIIIRNAGKLPVDVFSGLYDVIQALIEGKQQLDIYGRMIQISSNFRLIGICEPGDTLLKSSIGKYFFTVQNTPHSAEQIEKILSHVSSPALSVMLPVLRQEFQINMKDIMKLARRLQYNINTGVLTLNDAFINNAQQKQQPQLIHAITNSLSQQYKLVVMKEILEVWGQNVESVEEQKKRLETLAFFFRVDKNTLIAYSQKIPPQISFDANKQQLKCGRFTVDTRLYNYSGKKAKFDVLREFENNSVALTSYTSHLLQKIVASVVNNENLLLFSTTGVGKTFTLELAAKLLGNKLIVINLSSQTDISDLVGGYKPVTLQNVQEQIEVMAEQLIIELLDLEVESNKAFQQQIEKLFDAKQFQKAAAMLKAMIKQLQQAKQGETIEQAQQLLIDNAISLLNLHTELLKTNQTFCFTHYEGPLVEAARRGYFVLFDEINLASDEIHSFLANFLSSGELSVPDKASESDIAVLKHPHFRAFAGANPSAEAGRRKLPQALIEQFTIQHIQEPETFQDLLKMAETYLGNQQLQVPVQDVAELFTQLKQMAPTLQTIAGRFPVYSIRSYCRAMRFAQKHPHLKQTLFDGFKLFFTAGLDDNSYQTINSLLMENLGFSQYQGEKFIPQIAKCTFLYQNTQMLNVDGRIHFPAGPRFRKNHDGHSLLDNQKNFVITEANRRYVQQILLALLSGTSVLLEGPTSAGKSSIVSFLADLLGYELIRINNHENIDLQDYLGSYQPDERGHLAFQEGPLVRALRRGAWILLDELNLCPSEVLEALNRLLDDNKELQLQDSGTFLKPSPGFALFATQNPAGLVNGVQYGGRRRLSDAFRNRFVVLQLAELSAEEIAFIISQRAESSSLPESFTKKLMNAVTELKLTLGHLLSSQNDLETQTVTLRDVFRIADRQPAQLNELAMHTFILLGERQRTTGARNLVAECIKKHIYAEFDVLQVQNYYRENLNGFRHLFEDKNKVRVGFQEETFGNIAQTDELQRILGFLLSAFRYGEGACLVGHFGSGKTQAVELAARLCSVQLKSVALHRGTDVSDLIGALRPPRARARRFELPGGAEETFEAKMSESSAFSCLKSYFQRLAQTAFTWAPGPLLQAAASGDVILLDEANLCGPAVLERLNSLLEVGKAGRSLTIAEIPAAPKVKAVPDFHTACTMNPAGDYGKRELSPALRSRLAEVFVPPPHNPDQLSLLLHTRITYHFKRHFSNSGDEVQKGMEMAQQIAEFLTKFFCVVHADKDVPLCQLSVRDLVAAAELIVDVFINKKPIESKINFQELIHLLDLAFLKGIGLRCDITDEEAKKVRETIIRELSGDQNALYTEEYTEPSVSLIQKEGQYALIFSSGNEIIASFPTGPLFELENALKSLKKYCLTAPTTFSNAVTVICALSHAGGRSLLLQSPPGAGKTSLVEQLAQILGYELIRVNLSEHIDISDLLGADLPGPTKGTENVPNFVFTPGPVTLAVKNSSWLLLDELNLANQTVLEGLNSLLDHRRQLFIPETGQTLKCGPQFQLFTAQNPSNAGGGRKRLPQSFLSRFVSLNVHELKESDYEVIIQSIENINAQTKQILLTAVLAVQKQLFKILTGGPWEVNLRDVYRIIDSVIVMMKQWEDCTDKLTQMSSFIQRVIMYQLIARYRTQQDVILIAETVINSIECLNIQMYKQDYPILDIENNTITLGCVRLSQQSEYAQQMSVIKAISPSNAPLVEQTLIWLNIKTPVLFVSSGENQYVINQVVENVSQLFSQEVMTISLSKSTDVSDLIGQFQQFDKKQQIHDILEEILAKYYDYINKLQKQSLDQQQLANKQESFLRLKDEIISLISMNKATLSENQTENSTTTQYEHSEETMQELCDKVQNIIKQAQQLEILSEVMAKILKNRIIQVAGSELNSKFVWQDGPVVSAMKLGLILHLQNVNMCSAAVLDRLNPLLERGGHLTIFERGMSAQMDTNNDQNGEHSALLQQQMNQVYQSEKFKVILSYDPYFGEVSPAIRNRSQQICIDTIEQQTSIMFENSIKDIKYEIQAQQQHFYVTENSLQMKLEHVLKQINHLSLDTQYQILQQIFQQAIQPNPLSSETIQLLNNTMLAKKAISNIIMQKTLFFSTIASLQILEIKNYDVKVLDFVMQLLMKQQLNELTLSQIKNPSNVIEVLGQYFQYQYQNNQLQQVLNTLLANMKNNNYLFSCQIYELIQQEMNRSVLDYIIIFQYTIRQLCDSNHQDSKINNEILMMIDQFYMQRQITMFQKQLLNNLIKQDTQNMNQVVQWEETRNLLQLSTLNVQKHVSQQSEKYIENNNISLKNGMIIYKKEDVLKYIQFQIDSSQDPLLKLVSQCSHDMMKDSLIFTSILNSSTYLVVQEGNCVIKQVSVLKNNLICQNVIKNIAQFYKIHVNNSEQIQNVLKNQFNMLKLHSSRILKAKYDIVGKLFTNINKYNQLLNKQIQSDENIQVTDIFDIDLLMNMLKKSINILKHTDFSNQIDPSLFYGKQKHVIESLKQQLQESVHVIQNMQVILESRITESYFQNSDLMQIINNHLQQLQILLENTSNKAIVRTDNAEDFYVELQIRLENVGINQVDDLFNMLLTNLHNIMQQFQQTGEVSEQNKKQMQHINLKIQQVIVSFNGFIVDSFITNLSQSINFIDCLLPVFYAMLSIIFILMHITEVLKQMENYNVSGAYLYVRSIYGLETPVKLRQYLSKFYPKTRQSANAYLCDYLINSSLGLSIGDYMNIGADYTAESLESFAKAIKSCSLFKTQSQSTSDTEAYKKEFEEQINIIFGDQQRQLSEEQISTLETGKFVAKIGFIMLQQYLEYFQPDVNISEQVYGDLHLNQLSNMTIIFKSICKSEVIQDSTFYLHNLALIRQSFDQLQRNLNENMQALLKVKSHKQRRSAVCKNIHINAYPAEVFNFQETIIQIKKHAEQLLDQYTQTAILLQIVETTTNFLDFPFVTTPLGKCLLILELLAQQMLQWDSTSPKALHFPENNTKDLKQCIIRWRRLEVMGWSGFFTDVSAEFMNVALMQWPQLLFSSVQICKQNEVHRFESFRNQIFDYSMGGAIGEADWRSKMLLTLISALSELPDEVETIQTQAALFKAAILNERFLDQVQQQIDNGRKLVIKDFSNQLQLFQWRERTVERDSKKAHTAVAKLVRRFKEIQQQEFIGFIKQVTENDFIIKQFNAQQIVEQTKQNAINKQTTIQQEELIEIMQVLSEFHSEKNVQNQQQLVLRNVIKYLTEFLEMGELSSDFINYLKSLTSEQLVEYALIFKDIKEVRLLLSYFVKFEDCTQRKHQNIQNNDFIQIKLIVAQIITQMLLRQDLKQQNEFSNIGYNYQLRQILNITNAVYSELKYVFNNQIDNAVKNQIDELLKSVKSSISTQQVTEYNEKVLIVIQSLINTNNYASDVFTFQKQVIEQNLSNLVVLGSQTTTLKKSVTSKQITQIYQQHIYDLKSFASTLSEEKLYILSRSACKLIDCLACIVASGYKARKKQDKQEKDQMQQDQQPQDGVGLGNARGEQDITNQVKEEDLSEDQLMGNQDEQSNDNNDASSKDEGIDLSNDFGGHEHGVDQGEEGEEGSEKSPDSDFGSQDLENGQDEDKRQADVDENNEISQNAQEKSAEQRKDDQLKAGDSDADDKNDSSQKEQNEDENQEINEDRPEVFPEFPSVDDDLEAFEEINDQNISGQSEDVASEQSDHQISELFDEVFKSDVQGDEEELENNSNQISVFSDIEQHFEEKSEQEVTTDKENTEPEIDQQNKAENDEMQFNKASDEEDSRDNGFNDGDKAGNNNFKEQKSKNDDEPDKLPQQNENDEKQQIEEKQDGEVSQSNEEKSQKQEKHFDEKNKATNKNKDLKCENDQNNEENQEDEDYKTRDRHDKSKELIKNDDLKHNAKQHETPAEESQNDEQTLEDAEETSKVTNVENSEKNNKTEQNKTQQYDDDENKFLDDKNANNITEYDLLNIEKEEEINNLSESNEEIYGDQLWDEQLQDKSLQTSINNTSERLKAALEPLTRSGLIGDFRSGKRLNMRKIVGFVASHFRNNKIWLRRSQPQKRDYNIIIAIDNSASVINRGIYNQIIKALLILQESIRQSELGKLCIISFGKTTNVLLEFTDGYFSSQIKQLMKKITFNEKQSNFEILFNKVRDIYQNLPNDAEAQKNIFICLTDGQVQNREVVAKSYKKLLEDGIIPIVVINDKTIFDQKTVQFVTGKDGKRAIKKTPYLEDNYPFTNYAVCDIMNESLGDALCALLLKLIQ